MLVQIPTNFVKHILERGGSIVPLLIDPTLTRGTGTTNPSVLVEGDKVLINVRHVEYTLYHSELKKFPHPWGPVQYLHSENEMALKTNNFLGTYDPDTKSYTYNKVDTSKLDVPPIWEFVGLEDARLVRWDGKLYLSGVRRDTTPNGQGRMELSELDEDFNEVKRSRIPAPNGDKSYCEKNWMPILDMPYHYVKWCNPTEVVKVDPNKLTCETVHLGNGRIDLTHDLRGGSQVIPYGEYRLAITHQVDLFKSRLGRRDAVYRNRFVVWDRDWKIVRVSEPFDFLGGHVEFVCGAAWSPDSRSLLVTFGYQDNSAFVVEIPKDLLDETLNMTSMGRTEKRKPKVIDYFHYFNEEEILELRVRALESKVDQFIIAEANATFTGAPRKYSLVQTIDRLGLPKEKIRVIQVDFPDNIGDYVQDIDVHTSSCLQSHPSSVLFWTRERIQQNALNSVIGEYEDDDVFIVTDCDEIVRPELVDMFSLHSRENPDKVIKVPMALFEGRADLRTFMLDGSPARWDWGPLVCTKKLLEKHTVAQLRRNYELGSTEAVHITHAGKRIEDAGWHFSWMGGSERSIIKANSFSHANDCIKGLVHENINSAEMLKYMGSYVPEEGGMNPVGNKNTVLKRHPLEELPQVLFTLPRVREYLLPNYEEDYGTPLSPLPVIGTAIVNGIDWLKRLIATVDYPVSNFVIINNNGRGELDDELKEIANKPHLCIGKIHVCTPPGNIGCAGAWNLIIKSFLTSPYWVIVNHDVCFEPGFLKEMVTKAQDPEVGMIHGSPGDRGDGMYDLFLIRDWVVQKFGLFDENLYPGYDEDVDYNIRLSKNPPKRILSVGVPYKHGDKDYATSGSQTWRVDESLKPKLYGAREMNESEYMVEKWGRDWTTSPYSHPFSNPSLPLSATTFNLEFARRKHLGF